ncbi:MAG: hypothetical protein H7A21_18305 [Spirochaetales bacterium]|nr:hypothetical protein [Leptospiraceae bacterium]MCP5483394.1 hypothetical protein [Spirochaetales bacterium]
MSELWLNIRNAILKALRPQGQFVVGNLPELPLMFLQAGILMGLCTLAVYLTAILGPSDPPGAAAVLYNEGPSQRLFFPIYWAGYFIIFSAFRFLALMLLGGNDRTYSATLTISVYAGLPFMVVGAVLIMINNVIPYSLHAPDGIALVVRVLLHSLVLLVGLGIECRACVIGFQERFGQTKRRAVLTWITPTLALILVALLILLTFASLGPATGVPAAGGGS